MLTSNDVHGDMKKYLNEEHEEIKGNYFRTGVFRGIILTLKVLITIRLNLTRIMEKLSINLLESKKDEK